VAVNISTGTGKEAADRYRESISTGTALTGTELAELFDKSPTSGWGRQIIRAVHEADGTAVPKRRTGTAKRTVPASTGTAVVSVPVPEKPQVTSPEVREAAERVKEISKEPNDRLSTAEPVPVPPSTAEPVPTKQTVSAWIYTWLTFVAGITLSIAANVEHSFVTAAGEPPAGVVIASAVWPILLYLTTEVLARVQWPRRWYYLLIRWGGVGTVALVSGIVSYRHMSSLLATYGEDYWISTLGPIAVDGAMVVAAAALLVMGRKN